MTGHEPSRWRHALVTAALACVWLGCISNLGWTQATKAKAAGQRSAKSAGSVKTKAAAAKPDAPAAKPGAEAASKAAAEEIKCETCHDQIGATANGGTRHPAVDMGCDSCHEAHDPADPIDKNKPKHLKKAVPALCADCHEVQQKAAKTKTPHTALEGCTDCHDPHASKNATLLKQAQPAVCETCHTEQAEKHQKDKFLHKPAFQTGCSTCHEPHGSDQVAHLRAPINELCLSCHDSRAKGESGSDEKTLVLFGGAVRLPGNYLAEVRRIDLNSEHSKGHPTMAHPVRTAGNVTSTGKPMVCTTCHDPHASTDSPLMFANNVRSKSKLCITCHG